MEDPTGKSDETFPVRILLIKPKILELESKLSWQKKPIQAIPVSASRKHNKSMIFDLVKERTNRKRETPVSVFPTIPHSLSCHLLGAGHSDWQVSAGYPGVSESVWIRQCIHPMAILIWLMIYPMMMKVDYKIIRNVGKNPMGLFVTWITNWLIEPFSM